MNVYRHSYTDGLLKFKRCDFFLPQLEAHGRVEEDQREFDECIPVFVYR